MPSRSGPGGHRCVGSSLPVERSGRTFDLLAEKRGGLTADLAEADQSLGRPHRSSAPAITDAIPALRRRRPSMRKDPPSRRLPSRAGAARQGRRRSSSTSRASRAARSPSGAPRRRPRATSPGCSARSTIRPPRRCSTRPISRPKNATSSTRSWRSGARGPRRSSGTSAARPPIRRCGRPIRQAQNLLDFFLLEKAFYEIEYELMNRPAWLHVPLDGTWRILQAPQRGAAMSPISSSARAIIEGRHHDPFNYLGWQIQ